MKSLPNIENKKIRRGQRWQNQEGDVVEITATQGDRLKTKNPYGGKKSHTITKYDLFKYWKLL